MFSPSLVKIKPNTIQLDQMVNYQLRKTDFIYVKNIGDIYYETVQGILKWLSTLIAKPVLYIF